MRQRLAIARAFLHDPTVLILDEPFTSLDDRAIALLQSILREARQRGASVVMSTHQLREALELASHVALLQRGKIAFNGVRTTEMVEDPAWLYTPMANRIWTIAAKDLRSELRSKESINAAISFALVMLLIFNFAFDPSAEESHTLSGGLLWIIFAFAGTLVLNRSFARELPNDCLDALIAAPIPGYQLFLGKAIASFILVLGVELISLPVFGIFYDIDLIKPFWRLLLVMGLGTWALTVIGPPSAHSP